VLTIASASIANTKLQDSEAAVKYFEQELNYTINAFGAKNVVDGKVKNVTIIDVRSAKSFAEGHIPGAINIPYDKFNSFEGTEKEYPGLRKDGFNYVYCYELHCNLGPKACMKFASLGYPVKEIKGRYNAWVEHKYPVATK
jgi:rhodanese-related sulfurtransferase